MDPAELTRLVVAANSVFTNPRRNKIVYPNENPSAHEKVRFELYHAGPSLCSHKVRMTLAEKGLPYTSHDVDMIFRGSKIPENYHPDYVRLRLASAPNAELVSSYTGRSAVDSEGFDPAVVPTLVDHETATIVTDSAKICRYLGMSDIPGPDLYPSELAGQIDALISIVDSAPHVALLYGANPKGDHRPAMLKQGMKDVHSLKIRALTEQMQSAENDNALKNAYQAKIQKETAAQRFVKDTSSMNTIVGQMKEGIDALESQLATHGEDYACGKRITLADIMWAASLFRMRWVGIGHLFAHDSTCTSVARYADRLFERSTFRASVFDWPGAHTPSRHIPEMNTLAFKTKFFWTMFRG